MLTELKPTPTLSVSLSWKRFLIFWRNYNFFPGFFSAKNLIHQSLYIIFNFFRFLRISIQTSLRFLVEMIRSWSFWVQKWMQKIWFCRKNLSQDPKLYIVQNRKVSLRYKHSCNLLIFLKSGTGAAHRKFFLRETKYKKIQLNFNKFFVKLTWILWTSIGELLMNLFNASSFNEVLVKDKYHLSSFF